MDDLYVFRCVVEDCRREFTTWNDLYEHRTEHLQRSYVCRVCLSDLTAAQAVHSKLSHPLITDRFHSKISRFVWGVNSNSNNN